MIERIPNDLIDTRARKPEMNRYHEMNLIDSDPLYPKATTTTTGTWSDVFIVMADGRVRRFNGEFQNPTEILESLARTSFTIDDQLAEVLHARFH